MKIIGFAGRAGVGKDTAALHICDHYDATSVAFAEPLYAMLGALLNLTEDELRERLANRAWKEAPHALLAGRSPRQALQWLGDFLRERFGDGILIHHLQERLSRLSTILPHQQIVVITDLRLDIEAEWVRCHGGHVIHLTRDDAPAVAEHATEAGICMYQEDAYAWNNGTVEQLHERLDLLMTKILSAGKAA